MKTSAGEIPIEVPRDREGNFEPVTLRRYATASNELEDRIIGMYAHGMSTLDIQDHLEETFGMDVSPTTISAVTEEIWPLVEAWQTRNLEAVYPFVFLRCHSTEITIKLHKPSTFPQKPLIMR